MQPAHRVKQPAVGIRRVVASRIRLAEALRDAGRPDTAEPLLRAALSLAGTECPEYLEHAWYALGTCQLTLGDPDSVHFFHDAGLDYVSCSPFRVPVSRLEAGRAAMS